MAILLKLPCGFQPELLKFKPLSWVNFTRPLCLQSSHALVPSLWRVDILRFRQKTQTKRTFTKMRTKPHPNGFQADLAPRQSEALRTGLPSEQTHDSGLNFSNSG
jgi:hypothetical protein